MCVPVLLPLLVSRFACFTLFLFYFIRFSVWFGVCKRRGVGSISCIRDSVSILCAHVGKIALKYAKNQMGVRRRTREYWMCVREWVHEYKNVDLFCFKWCVSKYKTFGSRKKSHDFFFASLVVPHVGMHVQVRASYVILGVSWMSTIEWKSCKRHGNFTRAHWMDVGRCDEEQRHYNFSNNSSERDEKIDSVSRSREWKKRVSAGKWSNTYAYEKTDLIRANGEPEKGTGTQQTGCYRHPSSHTVAKISECSTNE